MKTETNKKSVVISRTFVLFLQSQHSAHAFADDDCALVHACHNVRYTYMYIVDAYHRMRCMNWQCFDYDDQNRSKCWSYVFFLFHLSMNHPECSLFFLQNKNNVATNIDHRMFDCLACSACHPKARRTVRWCSTSRSFGSALQPSEQRPARQSIWSWAISRRRSGQNIRRIAAGGESPSSRVSNEIALIDWQSYRRAQTKLLCTFICSRKYPWTQRSLRSLYTVAHALGFPETPRPLQNQHEKCIRTLSIIPHSWMLC